MIAYAPLPTKGPVQRWHRAVTAETAVSQSRNAKSKGDNAAEAKR